MFSLGLLGIACPGFTSASLDKDKTLILTLEQAVDIALNRNRSIIRSAWDRDSAGLGLDSSRSGFDVKFTPSAGAGITDETDSVYSGITVSKEFMTGIRFSGTPRLGKTEDGFNSALHIALDIPLLRQYGKLINTDILQTSEFSVRNAERSFIRTRENAFISAVNGYYTIVELRKNVELNRFLVEKFNAYSIIARTKTDIGLAEPLDVYRSEIQAKNAQVSLSSALELLQNAKYNLKSLLAIPQDMDIRIEDTILDTPDFDLSLEEAEQIAFHNSLDIQQAEDSLNEKKRAEKVARQRIKPDLKLSLQYALEGDSQNFSEDLLDAGENTWGVFLVSSTDFERRTEKNNYLKSRLSVASAKMELEEAKDSVSKRIRAQLDTLTEARDRVGILEKKILDATGKLKLATVKFDNGLSGNFDMIEAETELNQARVDLIRAKINYITNTYQLRKTMGTLIQNKE